MSSGAQTDRLCEFRDRDRLREFRGTDRLCVQGLRQTDGVFRGTDIA